MKIRMQVTRDDALLHEAIYEIDDAESFSRACTQAWNALTARDLRTATSIGALYDAIETEEQLLDGLVIAFSVPTLSGGHGRTDCDWLPGVAGARQLPSCPDAAAD